MAQRQGVAVGRPMGVVLHRLLRFVVGLSVFVSAFPQGGTEEIGLLHRPYLPAGFRLVGGLCRTAGTGLGDPRPGHLDGAYDDGEELTQ